MKTIFKKCDWVYEKEHPANNVEIVEIDYLREIATCKAFKGRKSRAFSFSEIDLFINKFPKLPSR